MFDGKVLVPYSTGLIWSHCKTNKIISDNYKLDGWYYYRQSFDVLLFEMDNPSVVGFSCWTWNWEYTLKMAKMIKDKYPNCLIVFGGMQQPNSKNSLVFFKQHPYVDIVVDYEGEITFEEILLENLLEVKEWMILGCAVNTENGLLQNSPRPRIADINSMPSPYLNGLFDDLLINPKYELQAIIESTRGCPYSCTYCDIGSRFLQKIKTQSIEKLKKEWEWIVDNGFDYVVNADSNFGLIGYHAEFIDWIVEKYKQTGRPTKFQNDWAKGKADRYIGMAKKLNDVGILKGMGVSLQSTNDVVQKAIKRINITSSQIEETLNLYDKNNLGSYVELIIGLPMETVESWKTGIVLMLEYNQHTALMMHPLTALPNTPFGDQSYIDEFKLKIKKLRSTSYHIKLENSDEYPDEFENIVIGTSVSTEDDWKEMFMFKWMIGSAHYLGLTQYISRVLRCGYDISYKDFYYKLFEYSKNTIETILGDEYDITLDHLDHVLNDNWNWGRIDKTISNYTWEYDEYTALKCTIQKSKFLLEMKQFVMSEFDVNEELLDEIIKFQQFALVDPTTKYPLIKQFKYNIPDILSGKEIQSKISNIQFTLKGGIFKKTYDSDYEMFAKEIYWWGRKAARYKLNYVEEI